MILKLIDFDLSVALKDAGCDIQCNNFYSFVTKNGAHGRLNNWNAHAIYVSRPNIYEVAQWLREKHRLHVIAIPDHDNNVWAYQICKLFSGFVAQEKFYDRLPDHDTALLSGIQYCLTVLNEKK